MMMTAALMAAALQGAVAAGPRKDFVACLNSAIETAAKQKLAGDAFADFAHKNCASIEQGFKAELVKFGMKNGLKRAAAGEDAQLQVDDYVFTAEQRYLDKLAHPESQ